MPYRQHISFTPSGPLLSPQLEVVPELRPYIEVVPNSFGNLKPGQRVSIALIVFTTATTTPRTLEGSIHIKGIDGNNKKTISKPLPVSVSISWPTVKAGSVTVSLPPALQIQGGKIEPALVEQRARQVTAIDIPLSVTNKPPLSAFGLVIFPASEVSLFEWFRNHIDSTGVLLSSGAFRYTRTQSGNELLLHSGPIPQSKDLEPLALAYVRSSTSLKVATITISQDNYLSEIGIDTAEGRTLLVKAIAENLVFE
jgi:hypothetical protein